MRTWTTLFVASLLACGPAAPVADGGFVSDDADGDGLPAEADCDDADSTVGESSSRPCSTACGTGTESCTAGTWGACDAPTDCVCSTEGERRVASCGLCGMQSQMCTGGVWAPASSCLGEGVCVPASVESRPTTACGTEERICDATCAWGAWLRAVPDGECTPGSVQTCGSGAMGRICDDTCHYGECI